MAERVVLHFVHHSGRGDRRRCSPQASHRYKIQLEGLEDQLLQRLADAPADILTDVGLIEVAMRESAFGAAMEDETDHTQNPTISIAY